MTDLNIFQTILSDEWEARMQFDPLFATLTGDHRFNDRLPRVRPQDYAARLESQKGMRARLAGVDRQALPEAEQLNYAIFKQLLDLSIRENELGGQYLPVANSFGFHAEFPDLPSYAPLDTVQDYENYIARLAGFAQYTADYIELMRQGLTLGYLPARPTMEGVQDTIRSQIASNPQSSPLGLPFEKFPSAIESWRQERLRRDGRLALQSSVVTGYQKLWEFMEYEYIPAARASTAASDLPDGAAFYRHRIEYFTSLPLSPEDVHQTGLDEVRRIRSEMLAVAGESGYGGDLPAFLEYLRSDPQFYANSAQELLEKTALVLKRADGELPLLFKNLPRMPYGIREIPEHSAPGNSTAYYWPPAGDGSKAGMYYVNTYDLPSRPLYEIEALSLHEAVPGHHLQIAIQQELGELRPFRRFDGFTSFVEGWALYAERLGLEIGFYQDSYSDFGRLSYEMWRACRLVVDTGLHALGWTRQQAIDYMLENTSSTLLNVTNEVDRYIYWPGQSLAYKIGELKIRTLRAQAEAALGARFDLREFHDLLLGSGAVPLGVLEQMVVDWINSPG